MGNLTSERATDLSRATQLGRPGAGMCSPHCCLPGLDVEKSQEGEVWPLGVVRPGNRGLEMRRT